MSRETPEQKLEYILCSWLALHSGQQLLSDLPYKALRSYFRHERGYEHWKNHVYLTVTITPQPTEPGEGNVVRPRQFAPLKGTAAEEGKLDALKQLCDSVGIVYTEKRYERFNVQTILRYHSLATLEIDLRQPGMKEAIDRILTEPAFKHAEGKYLHTNPLEPSGLPINPQGAANGIAAEIKNIREYAQFDYNAATYHGMKDQIDALLPQTSRALLGLSNEKAIQYAKSRSPAKDQNRDITLERFQQRLQENVAEIQQALDKAAVQGIATQVASLINTSRRKA